MIKVKYESSGNKIDYEGLTLTVSKLIDMLRKCDMSAEVNIVNSEGREYYTEVNSFNDGTVIIDGIQGNYMTVSELIEELNNYDMNSEVVGRIMSNRIRNITHIWNEQSEVFIVCDI